ncbi:MAG: peptidoglycan-binding domain-containing protein [bacterium]
MKRIITVALSLALAFSVVAPVAASAQSMTTTLTAPLTIGSTGSAVVALQNFLVSKGLLTMPAGVSMGHFGPLTRSAVKAYQMAKSISPALGYFGPITAGIANSDMGGTTTTVAGCSAGAMFNAQTGASCTTTTTTTTTTVSSNVEGSLDVRLASTPSDNLNIKTQTDVQVYGLELRARISDVTVQTIDLQVAVSNGSSNENPSTLINTIKVWDGSNVIATLPVNLTTFTKDQNQIYYVRIPALNFVVAKDATKTLTVSFSTNSIDNDRGVTIDGYNNTSLRAVSGNGVSSFYSFDSASGTAYTRTHTFKKPGTSTLTLSSSGTTLRSANNRVNGDANLTDVVIGTFNLQSSSGESRLLTVNASTTASGTLPISLYLYNGSTLLKQKSVPSNGSVSFDNLDTTNGSLVPNSETPTTFTIKAEFPSTAVNATFASTTITSVVYQTPNGNTATASGNAVNNANQYVYTKAAIITLAGTPTITAQNAAISGGTSTVTAVFPLNIKALGGNVILPGNGDVTVTFSNGIAATAANTVVATLPSNDISNGSSATVTVTAKSVGFAAGLYNAGITQIKWNAGNGTTTQTYGFDDFKTSAAANQQ